LKLAPSPTAAAITARDLMTRIYVFADDSMQGREATTEGNRRGNAYIEGELRRLGLRPAGDSGSYLQAVPFVRRGFDQTAAITVGATTLRSGADFHATTFGPAPRSIDGARVVYGGTFGDEASYVDAEAAQGKVVLLGIVPGAPSPRFQLPARFADAAGVAIAAFDELPSAVRAYLTRPQVSLADPATTPAVAPPAGPLGLLVSRRAAAALLGLPDAGALGSLAPGALGAVVRGTVAFVATPVPAYNVVAILPGSDPALRGQYVALGAHNDHVGVAGRAVDHDSLKAHNAAARRAYVALDEEGDEVLTPAQLDEYRRRVAAIRVDVDGLRRRGPARRDSINNGADDDGSGSMALLEIAENLAAMPTRPRRSVLFVWHTAEEKGLLGARWFADHPTVPRDSIVAQLNIDMIGRGATADDQRNGVAGFVGVIGAQRLSTELGALLDTANAAQPRPLRLDAALDANGHPSNFYCRSDHFHYARYGIPIAFFFTGVHGDYHQVTDEPQYLHYPNYARVTGLVRDLALRVANRDRRPAVDRPKPDPDGPCRQ
jgi:hypothetical protein